MKWNIQYRVKGDNTILNEIVDLHFEKKNDVKKWYISKTSTFVNCSDNNIIGGLHQDIEYVNCKKLE